MIMSLGKRKRLRDSRTAHGRPYTSNDQDDLRARFQKAFEAKFKPLPAEERLVKDENQVSNTDESSGGHDVSDEGEWAGCSDDDEVEVVHHSGHFQVDRSEQRKRLKDFMSSKPPSLQDASDTTGSQAKRRKGTADETAETLNLKNDLALQRLLKESHLLDASSFSGTASVTPQGKSRIKALDLRLQDLGAKNRLDDDVKMPMLHRKGIMAKSAFREQKRRKEAAENGIILAKVKSIPGKTDKRRERGIAAPTIGKFRSGTLKLNAKDIRSIQNGTTARSKNSKRRK